MARAARRRRLPSDGPSIPSPDSESRPAVVADLTHAYHETSRGIHTFLDLKRRYALEHTDGHRALIVPGAADGMVRGDRWTTHTVAAPRLPGGSTYQFWWRTAGLRAALAPISSN